MRSPEDQLATSLDPLGETLHLLRLQGTLYCRADLTAPWGAEMPAIENALMFHIVTQGTCLLEVSGHEPLALRRGSIALVPHGRGHRLRSNRRVKTPALFDLPIEKVSDRYEILRHGGGGEPSQMICGVSYFSHAAAEHLVALLPPVVHADTWDDDGGWLASTLRFIAREASELRPGGETVITRLADVLVVQVLRQWLDTTAPQTTGWLAALRDPQIGPALARIHREPGRDWSVDTLAAAVHMSRSAFAARFTELVGDSAIRYLTRWRMQLAREALRDAREPLPELAERFGYRSEAAFCRAFKREFGVPPGSARRDS